MRATHQWMTCRRCETRFKADSVSGVPIDQWVAFMMATKCPSCGAGADLLSMGGSMSLKEDLRFRNVPPEAPLRDRYHDWREWGDVGLSSSALVYAVTGWRAIEGDMRTLPSDPSDFRRILLAMDRMPELRHEIDKARAISPGWSALVDRFAEIETTLLEELGPELDNGSANCTYAILREVAGTARNDA